MYCDTGPRLPPSHGQHRQSDRPSAPGYTACSVQELRGFPRVYGREHFPEEGGEAGWVLEGPVEARVLGRCHYIPEEGEVDMGWIMACSLVSLSTWDGDWRMGTS